MSTAIFMHEKRNVIKMSVKQPRHVGQWRRNEFEGGGSTIPEQKWGTYPAPSAGNFFVVPLHFLALKVQLVVWWALSWWSVQFCQFLVCCSSTHRAPPCPSICKSEGTCLVPNGVGTTDVGDIFNMNNEWAKLRKSENSCANVYCYCCIISLTICRLVCRHGLRKFME